MTWILLLCRLEIDVIIRAVRIEIIPAPSEIPPPTFFPRQAPYKVKEPVTLKVQYLFAERATNAISTVPGTRRVDERTVAVTYPTLAELRDAG